jgi:membrane protein YqaA with SNARE-associated domain
MKDMLAWAQTWAIALGGPGLFLVALVDASFLTLPELVDVLVVVLTIKHKSLMLYYAAAGTAGSVLGSMSVYYLGRKGGEALLRRRFGGDQVDRTMARFRKWGFAAILVPAMLPPPTPFKLLCVAAGATGMTARSFALATAIGRGLRYAGLGLLAYYLGQPALEYLDRNGTVVGWWLLALSVVGLGIYYWRHQRQRAAI